MKKVFIDSSGFKALLDPTDDFYQQAQKIWSELEQDGVVFVTSNYIIDECATLIRYRAGREAALAFKKLVLEDSKILEVMRVSTTDEAEAWSWFENKWSKLSFTDCVTFAQLQRLEITRVLGFDQHFEKAGFILEK